MGRAFRMAFENHRTGPNLYHYAAAKHPILKTRMLSSPPTPTEIKKAEERTKVNLDPGTYYEHISFFFEPVPLDLVGKTFGKDHPFWYPGHEIYEHTIPIDTLPDFKYRIVETPLANELFYKTDWDKEVDMAEYFKKLYDVQKQHGEIGESRSTFISTAQHLKGTVRKAYEELPKRPNWEELKSKYAATVPHVMLYPKGGEVIVAEIKAVKVA